MRLTRVDRWVSRIDLVETPVAPTPGHATATRTPEGYLRVEALTCRDGLLKYSDGESSWWEYRPRSELVAAAQTFSNVPVTNDHPDAMVTAETWGQVARGHGVGIPTVTDPIDGVSYLHDHLLITDADLIRAIEGGKRKLSIGFTSEVVPTSDGAAMDGTKCDAVQTKLVGNHYADVDEGRAGPACRVLFDSGAWTIDPASPDSNKEKNDMKNQRPTKGDAKKNDVVGAPTETVEIQAPDGSMAVVPTWVAAMLQELEQLKAPVPPAPPAPVAPAPPTAPVDAAMPPEEENKDAAKDEEKEEPGKDSAKAVRRRARLERLAVRADMTDETIDSLGDDNLARAIVEARAPWASEDAKTARGDALDAIVSVATKAPAKVEKTDNSRPWVAPVPKSREDANEDPIEESEATFLESMGY